MNFDTSKFPIHRSVRVREITLRKKIPTWLLASILLATVSLAEAQQRGKVPRIGFLAAPSPSFFSTRMNAFREGLYDLGHVEGKNIAIEYRYAGGKLDRLPALAAELVRLKVDVIVTSSAPGAVAAKNATGTIPIVFVTAGDPVDMGLVTQPGATERQHHGANHPCPGIKRKTAGTTQGGSPQDYSGGRPVESVQSRLF